MNRWFVTTCLLLMAAGARAELTPIDAELKEDAITRITVEYDGRPISPAKGVTFTPPKAEYHYDLFIPKGYNDEPEARFPCVFIASASGNAKLGGLSNRVKRERFIAVMLVESKNGPWEPIVGNFCAAHDDVIKRVRIAEEFKYMTGQSGGARATTLCTTLRSGFIGICLQAAGNWSAWTCVQTNPSMAVCLTMGVNDKNQSEVPKLTRTIPPKTPFRIIYFNGGHAWAPQDQLDMAFDWLEQWTYFNAPAPSSATAKAFYARYFSDLMDQKKTAASDFEKYELMERADKLATVRGLSSDKVLGAQIKTLHQDLLELGKSPAIKKEMVARTAYEKVASAEDLGLSQANKADALKTMLDKASAAYQGVADKYPDTAYAAKAKAAIERIAQELENPGK